MLLLHKIELEWITSFQGSGTLWRLMECLTAFGGEALNYVLPCIYMCFSRALGIRLYLLLSCSGVLNNTLKLAFHLPRPNWMDVRVRPLTEASGYGMPSGHAVRASVVWPFIAKSLARGWAWVIAFAV